MDKRDLLDRLAANGDERLLLGRVWDKYEQCRRRNIPVVTGFLSPAEQELVRRLMGALDVREGWLLWGGYDTAQRRQAHFLPDWQTEPDFEAVAALRATFYEPNSLTHRDVLGSLMGLGVTRGSVDVYKRQIQDAPDAVELSQVRGEVELDHVSFTYPGSSEVLHDIDLTVAAGETVAIVGPSGGGKSTLCQLLPRFYDVDAGSIRVDGLDVRHVTQSSLRRAIGIVQQDVFLFADTIRENIRYGRPEASDEEVEAAAKRAEIYDDIMAMPDGFDTYVGERGTLLSGGQKQRVSIARIFLKDPPILILDEATSALDSVTEAKIQGAFDRLSQGRTTLIIAHRLSTIRAADRILVIRNGRIAEEGSHAQLLALNGAYAKLYHTQDLGGGAYGQA